MHREVEVLIIGTGFSGLGMAIELKRTGKRDFVVLEKAADLGGTWRDNSYPGCACDVPSHMYSFSFELNPRWSRMFARQPEIWDYLKRVAEKYRLREHIRFNTKVSGARWDEDAKVWHVATEHGDTYTAKAVVAGVGALHIPNIPTLPGIEDFTGRTFHSAEWDHDYDLRGKKVAVVGTGASAIQFVPRIVDEVGGLTLFQRTPPWIMPKMDRSIRTWEQKLFRALPFTQRLYRDFVYWTRESSALGFAVNPKIMEFAQNIAKRHMRSQVPDEALRAKLTPDYTMGCKRVLISNDYYPALSRPNVDLVTDGIAEVRANSVVDAAGVEHEVDVIIYGTGFHVVDSFDYLDITGKGGVDLAKQWREQGIETYYGITVSGFPNLFFLLGPNTGLGHNSVVFMIESQIRYVRQCLELLDRHQADELDVRPDVQARFNRQLQRKLTKGVWTEGGCKSWYLDARGINRTVWPGFTWRYWMRTKTVRAEDYTLTRARRARVPA
ncbi:cation diffusion facilitator CzcD-associated flavoprotein CzcO [Saccharothrix saharensis]|uniref:Cation diffusion facilitator CzcD-associated flavoprotein CzcO n=1 Tax=Saccharothrix saharensis TaxID=571190 RepID=A0A543JD24_9PSEU|nr:NAD(P)/FAD-dependent oxidoreductase [Saccharothrix saharensis]TQM80747.1 cation diffusion facilitator CzcD-associated flavoprotein CzcO [Saccharothrix saharensis]